MPAAWVLVGAIVFACGGACGPAEAPAIDASEAECWALRDEWSAIVSMSRTCTTDGECIVVGANGGNSCDCVPAIARTTGVNEATYEANGGAALSDRILEAGCMKYLYVCHAPVPRNRGCVEGYCTEEVPSCYHDWDAPPLDANPDGNPDATPVDAASIDGAR